MQVVLAIILKKINFNYYLHKIIHNNLSNVYCTEVEVKFENFHKVNHFLKVEIVNQINENFYAYKRYLHRM